MQKSVNLNLQWHQSIMTDVDRGEEVIYGESKEQTKQCDMKRRRKMLYKKNSMINIHPRICSLG